ATPTTPVATEADVHPAEEAAAATIAAETNSTAAEPTPSVPPPSQFPPAPQPAVPAPGAAASQTGTPLPTVPSMPPTTTSMADALTSGSAVSSSSDKDSGEDGSGDGAQTIEDLRRTRSSPLVRRIAKEHDIDISQLEGTGASGRVTKNDILSFIEAGTATMPQAAPPQTSVAPPPSPVAPSTIAPPASGAQTLQMPAVQAPPHPPVQPGDGDRVEPMSPMRRKIAEHMTLSLRTSAHVATIYEIDMTRVAKLRDQHRKAFLETTGTKLSFMPFIFQAAIQAIRQFPIFNAQVSSDQIIYKRDINLGIAVALDWGLIVPVIKRADELSIAGLARAANDLAERARTKQLKPDEVAGGTFTITNPGVFGGLFGTPIINQPQVAILGIGAIEKRPKVMTNPEGDDLLAIRSMAYFALSFDHRIIDGADAEKFLGHIKQTLEAGQFAL
ncbi:MAG: 2-oxo acid dehydrogenase subunit E2, partial [Pyrinomonadaceae bacterium]|nr:2-oxo acid dehydrogenase subunit E2 [Pyrinomonadaceae bacterium]